jgi:transcription antitermination factor NusG
MHYVSEQSARSRQCQPLAWYAAYVKHQHERKTADLLLRKGFESLVPQQKVAHRWKDRNKTLYVPLFPGYVFVQGDLQQKFHIVNTPGVFFLVESGGHACAIPRQEIESIRRLADSGVPAESHPFLTSGDRVQVRNGPLAGVVGILFRFKNHYRVVLSIELLEKAVSVEVELDNLEPAPAWRSKCSFAAA